MKISLFMALVGCAFENQLFFGVEKAELKIPFGKKRYDFVRMNDDADLEEMEIGGNLKIETIHDSAVLAIYKIKIDGESNEKQFRFNETVLPFTEVPAITKSSSVSIYSSENPELKWAKVNNGSLYISIENQFGDLSFSKIRFSLKNNESSFDPDLNVSSFLILRDSISDLMPGETKNYFKDLKNEWITDNMELEVAYINNSLSADQNVNGVDSSQFIRFNYSITNCSFDSSKVLFSNKTVEHDTSYAFNIKNINPRFIETKDAEIRVIVDNESPFLIGIEPQMDSLYSLNTNSIYEFDSIMVGAHEKSRSKFNIENTKLLFNSETKETGFKYKINLKSPDNSEYLRFSQSDSTFLKLIITGISEGFENERDFGVSKIDGSFVSKDIELEESKSEIDVDWSEFEGFHVDSIGVNLSLDILREGFTMDKIEIDTLYLRGLKKSGELSDLYNIEIPTLENFSDTTIRVTGFEDLINFKPDSIFYSGKAVFDYNGTINDSDKIKLNIEFGVPVQGVVEDTIKRSGDVETIEAFNKDDGNIHYKIDDLILDAFLNYQLTNKDSDNVEFWAEIEVLFSETATETFDRGKDSLTGDIKTLFKARVRNDNINEHGYYLSDPSINPQFIGDGYFVDNEGIHVNGELANKIINKDTYVQPVFRIFPTNPGKYIKMSIDDYIDVQLKANAKVTIKYEHNN
ncbi:MAG: hypothetical protein CR982_07020 [Candidatus Cloacimonadota bacterium]|nr:MAG: hypothetical protein CR982_07020 [Candidatus Cloacimonadota bacterium]PIE80650.1 MAG: hypothetical protein CSA15_01745 [Candidatus Delongbacteria bacterium]